MANIDTAIITGPKKSKSILISVLFECAMYSFTPKSSQAQNASNNGHIDLILILPLLINTLIVKKPRNIRAMINALPGCHTSG